MKKVSNKFSTICLLLALIASYENVNCQEVMLEKSMRINSYEYFGKGHNLFLTNVDKNFESDFNITKLDDAIEFVNKFNTSFALTLGIKDKEELKIFINSLNDYKRFVRTDILFKELFEDGLCFSRIKEALSIKVIDQFEFDKLNILVQATYDNYKGKVSNSEIEKMILSIQGELDRKCSKLGSEYGQILGITLSISRASIEWWNNKNGNGNAKIPAVVGADIAGAIIGAVSSGVGSCTTGGSVNWKSVAWGACAGAVMGSTGIVGKVGKWLSGLF